jgi:TusA-related sulfurtransferase
MTVRKVDARGNMCPQPIMETARAVKAAASGDIIIVEATDIGFYNDIEAWCRKTENIQVSLEKKLNVYVATIKKV